MADRDFEIKVRTTADTSGVKQTEAELARLKEQSGVSSGVAEQLAAVGVKFDPVKQAFVSIEQSAEQAAGHTAFMGAQLNKAKGEAIVLAREFATGGNYIRTMGSLLGALGVPASIIATAGFFIFEHFKKAAEETAKETARLQKFNYELEKSREHYEKIRTTKQWEDEAQKIEDTIERLKEKRTELEGALIPHEKEINALNAQIGQQQTQLSVLNEIASKAIDRKKTEEDVEQGFKRQTEEMGEQIRAYGEAREAAKSRLDTEKELLALEREVKDAQIDEARKRGDISSEEAVRQKTKARIDEEQAGLAARHAEREEAVKSAKDEQEFAKNDLNAQQKKLGALEDQGKEHEVNRTKLLAQAKATGAAAETARELAAKETRDAERLRALHRTDESEAATERARQYSEKAKLFDQDATRQRTAAGKEGGAKDDIDARIKGQKEIREAAWRDSEEADRNLQKTQASKEREDAKDIAVTGKKIDNLKAIAGIQTADAARAKAQHDADLAAEDKIKDLKGHGLDLAADRARADLDFQKERRKLIDEGHTTEEATQLATKKWHSDNADIDKKAQDKAIEAQKLQREASEDQQRDALETAKAQADAHKRGGGLGAVSETEAAAQKLDRAAKIRRDLETGGRPGVPPTPETPGAQPTPLPIPTKPAPESLGAERASAENEERKRQIREAAEEDKAAREHEQQPQSQPQIQQPQAGHATDATLQLLISAIQRHATATEDFNRAWR